MAKWLGIDQVPAKFKTVDVFEKDIRDPMLVSQVLFDGGRLNTILDSLFVLAFMAEDTRSRGLTLLLKIIRWRP